VDNKVENISFLNLMKGKFQAIAILFKLRLATFVVFSSVIGLVIASNNTANWLDILVISIAGFLVTGASNALNQIFEKDTDLLMERTKNRPVVTGYFSKTEASLYAGIAAVVGLLMITLYFNEMAGLLAAVSLITYAFIYTPLKKVNSIAVFIGAIPGALPPMIGAVAFDGYFGFWAIFLFSVQFIWQFPHFWAIAWVSFADYKKAGIMLLPSASGKSKESALITLVYALVLIPITILPYVMGFLGIIGTIVAGLVAVYFAYFAVVLYQKCDDKSARKLMFASFLYLPVVLFSYLIDKI
jgi:protoheme IX farnesyltransferase